MYLVGLNSGKIEPFYAKVLKGGAVHHYVSDEMIKAALRRHGWWWRRMVIPHRLPSDQDLWSLPPLFKFKNLP